MMTNLPRALALPLAWWVAVTTGDLRAVILVGLAAEALGLALAFLLLARTVGTTAWAGGGALAAAVAGIGLVGLWMGLRPDNGGLVLPPAWLGLALATLAAAAVWQSGALRAYLRQHRRRG